MYLDLQYFIPSCLDLASAGNMGNIKWMCSRRRSVGVRPVFLNVMY